jgi:hypothetical protein
MTMKKNIHSVEGWMNIITIFCREFARLWATWIWISEGDLELELKRPGDEKLRVDYTVSVEQHHRRQERQQDVDKTSSEKATSGILPGGSRKAKPNHEQLHRRHDRMTLSEKRAIANGNRKWTVSEKREAATAVTEYRKAVDDERTAIKAEKAETRAEEKLKAAEATLANRKEKKDLANRQNDERKREAEMKAEEERSSAEAAFNLRVNKLQYYTDLVHEQHLRRQKKLQEEAYERSRTDERQRETETKAEERNTAEAAFNLRGKTGNITMHIIGKMDKIKSDVITKCFALQLTSMGAYSVHSKSYEIIEHRVRPSIKLGKTCGGKAHNLRFIAMISYTGMIINDCKPYTERLGKKETYDNLHFQSMEAYSDHGSAPELYWHQERQHMMFLFL